MSDCKHCEHLTARWEDIAGEHKRWQCCHCGRIRDETTSLRSLILDRLSKTEASKRRSRADRKHGR